jgi:uncharacterized protein (DUF1810 family)
MQPDDPFSLQRFKSAQEPLFEVALSELRAGRKQSHWMWFIFPQLRGLGHSPTAVHYGIGGLPEAKAYLADAVLGYRLNSCTRTVLDIRQTSLQAIFGSPDDLKFRSSMTLFDVASDDRQNLFAAALARWCDGRRDDATLALLAAM